MTKGVFFTLSFVILMGCGGRAFDLPPQTHPANPNAPQTTFEMPSDVLTEEMAPVEEETFEHHSLASLPEQTEGALTTMLDAYFAIGDGLASDTIENVSAKAASMIEAFDSLTQEASSGDPHFWHTHQQEVEAIREQTHSLAQAPDLKSARMAYGILSDALSPLVFIIGVPSHYREKVYGFVCGMSFNLPQNGVWLQVGEDARNPYFGSAMLKCHEKVFELPVVEEKESAP